MLDENLPTFRLKPSTDRPKQNSTYFYSQFGADFEPSYSLRHADPEQHASRNRYAAALYDAFNQDVLYAEVLLIPEWTAPTLSAEQIRLNGGVPPPPEPITPSEFTIQLYNPDQQVVVRHKPGSFASAPSWEFEMPQQTFRAPSSSALDRTQHDPVASENTPKSGFRWKKDSKLSKDLACFLSGKSTNSDGSKKRNKEPDITVAIFKSLKEITLYEPNLQRIDIEDKKGFEVVLLLGAVVIRDVYFGQIKETFNVNGSSRRLSQSSSPNPVAAFTGARPTLSPQALSDHTTGRDPRVPPTDPRSQWEIDAETALLRRQAAAEERERKHKENTEQKQIKRMLEAEEKENKRRQAEVKKETERLQRLYGQEDASARPPLPPRHSAPQRPFSYDPQASAYAQHQFQQPQAYYPNAQFVHPGQPYNMPGGYPAQGGYLSPNGHPEQQLKPKSSFFGFRRSSNDGGDDHKLQRKRSAVF